LRRHDAQPFPLSARHDGARLVFEIRRHGHRTDGAAAAFLHLATVGSVMSIDWNGIFVPSLGIFEVVVRGSLMYLALFAILRFIARRQAGQFGPADLLVIVLIADAAQNGLGKEYASVTEGIVLVLTIVFWEYTIDWLAWRFPALRPVLV